MHGSIHAQLVYGVHYVPVSSFENERQGIFLRHKMNFDTLPSTDKFLFLMSIADLDILQDLGHYVTACFNKRLSLFGPILSSGNGVSLSDIEWDFVQLMM